MSKRLAKPALSVPAAGLQRWRLLRAPSVRQVALFWWLVVLLAILGRTAVSSRSPSVVPVYRTAGLLWLAGKDLYSPATNPHIYRYPPGFAAAFAPLTYLPSRAAELAWRSFAAAVMLSGLWLWAKHVLRLDGNRTAIFFLLALPLCLTSLNNGQANTLLLGLTLHGATAVIRGADSRGGLWVAVATAVKVYPIAVGLLMACVRPKRVLPGLVLGIAALAAIPYLLSPAEYVTGQYRSFYQSVTADTRREPDHPDPPRDLYLVLRTYVATPSERAYAAMVLAAAAVMAAAVAAAAVFGRDPRVALLLAFDLGCVWMTVFGPATEPHTYTLLAPTLATAVLLARQSRAQQALALAAFVLLVAPVFRDMLPNGRAFHNLGTQPLGGLVLTLVILWKACVDVLSGRRGERSPGNGLGAAGTLAREPGPGLAA